MKFYFQRHLNFNINHKVISSQKQFDLHAPPTQIREYATRKQIGNPWSNIVRQVAQKISV